MGSRTTVRPGSGSDRWFEIKSRIHNKLLNSLNPEQLRTLNKESVRAQIGSVVERLVADEGIPMTLAERERVIEEILSAVGRRIDDSSPIVDARLADGSRVCAVIPPLSLIGPVMSIRRYGKKVLSSEDLLKNETFTTGM